MNTEETRQRWLTLPEAAQHISMTANHFRELLLAGKVPPGIAFRPAGLRHWRIDADALDEWMRNGCFTVTPGGEGAA